MRRRTIIKGGFALGTGGIAGLAGSSLAGAQDTSPDPLVVQDFEESGEQNSLDHGWTTAALESAEVADGTLSLEYDEAGFYATRVHEDVSDYQYLVLSMRGTSGGEESGIQLEVGGTEGLLGYLTQEPIATGFSEVAVDLESMGVDRSAVGDVRLNFWKGESGAIEVDWIAFAASPFPEIGDDDGWTPPTTTEPDDPEARPWELEAGNEKEPEDVPAPSEITADTTLAELCPTYNSDDAHLYVPRDFLDYLPDKGSVDGDIDITEESPSDSVKAAMYDIEAIQDKVNSGELTMGELGTQALDHVKTYAEEGFPYHATAKLLPRLMLLPDETEKLTYHKKNNPWDQTAGPATPGNDPDQLIQHEWPTDARSYQPEEVYERDRAHDQPQHVDTDWTFSSLLSDDIYYDEDHPLLQTIRNNEHPVTGEDLGEGFTANAPMEATVRMHVENSNYWYQVLKFKNTQAVPYYVDAAVIWWVGPMGLSDLRNGHYDNPHRPNPGKGHPQRDIIEVVYDEDRSLSAYAVRIAQHDEPYNMRTAYPNQQWALEQGLPATDPVTGDERFTSDEERQELVDTMLDTLHVELERTSTATRASSRRSTCATACPTDGRERSRPDGGARGRRLYCPVTRPTGMDFGVLSTAHIGTGDVIPAIQKSEHRVAAIASRDADRAAEVAADLGIDRSYGSYEALLEDDGIDAVYNPLPNALHAEWTRKAADRGLHVLCEKPLTRDPDEARALFGYCGERDVTLMEAFMYRFHPRTERALEIVREELGAVRHVEATFTFQLGDRSDDIRVSEELDGGALMDVGCYAVSAARNFLGEPDRAYATAVDRYDSGVDSHLAGTLAYDDGPTTHVVGSFDAPHTERYRVLTEDGRLEAADCFGPEADQSVSLTWTKDGEERTETFDAVDHYRLQAEAFADAVESGERPRVNRAETVGNAAAIDALYESAERGEPVAVE